MHTQEPQVFNRDYLIDLLGTTVRKRSFTDTERQRLKEALPLDCSPSDVIFVAMMMGLLDGEPEQLEFKF